jgi:cytoplasmic iron level regulating protein YaaA (DUF328/UPF0246 family)
MIFVLSPAKALDYESPLNTSRFTEPDYLDDAAQLIAGLRELSHAEVARLMDLSDPLAALNVARYAEWSQPFTPANARPAVLAFNGDVYDGLEARSLSETDLDFAQQHLRILSGLYGLLKPLDLMQPYRLEMGTRFANARGKDSLRLLGHDPDRGPQSPAGCRGRRRPRGRAGEPRLGGVLQVGQAASPAGPPAQHRFRGLEGRALQDHQFLRQARPRPDGPLRHHPAVQEVEQLKDFAADGYAFAPEASDESALGVPAASGVEGGPGMAHPDKVAGLVRMKGWQRPGSWPCAVAGAGPSLPQGWGWVAAFAEAALIGALADWFAVVALFRHPLGLPIPHTAILPRNKARLADNLADLHPRSLSRYPAPWWPACAPPSLPTGWRPGCVSRANAACWPTGWWWCLPNRWISWTTRGCGGSFLHALRRRAGSLDMADGLGRLLDVMTEHGRHQALLDEGLRSARPRGSTNRAFGRALPA